MKNAIHSFNIGQAASLEASLQQELDKLEHSPKSFKDDDNTIYTGNAFHNKQRLEQAIEGIQMAQANLKDIVIEMPDE